jgi:hypothetical protein
VDPWDFGSDPEAHHWLTDPDLAPDPAFFVNKKCQQNISFF